MEAGLPSAAALVSIPSAAVNSRRSVHQFSSTSSCCSSPSFLRRRPSLQPSAVSFPSPAVVRRSTWGFSASCCLPLDSKKTAPISTKLYVSGLSFRTTEESLRKAFQNFGQLVEVNLVMDRIANRPRGFAFLRYASEEESRNAIEGMHGTFLDGRVIFVEVAKPRSEVRPSPRQSPRRY
ncbi:organelle RRM domain-containing protein 6, chloroplastic-like [Zingiber officinale]|uniref:RRM domain-containing protein n=1 Tax=Zingiber officinale TaxID=94328 RepID=A0A8J5FJS3_ZINOF|nr:organelle RRM domain-containing protein 6, chloroplastic-like [Zingiber officinale]KAG6488275.1 hypothetical protein ZIOFF_057034 [Zingiber officinale]